MVVDQSRPPGPSEGPGLAAGRSGTGAVLDRPSELKQVSERARPTSLASERFVEVAPALSSVLPEGGLRRGSTIEVGGASGSTCLALSLLSAATATGSWCAVVGVESFGALAAAEMGVDLDRLALVPSPGPLWATAAAALLDALDVVVVRPTTRARASEARKLSARARHRGAVLVVLSSSVTRATPWPGRTEMSLEVVAGEWQGLGEGDGYLSRRRL